MNADGNGFEVTNHTGHATASITFAVRGARYGFLDGMNLTGGRIVGDFRDRGKAHGKAVIFERSRNPGLPQAAGARVVLLLAGKPELAALVAAAEEAVAAEEARTAVAVAALEPTGLSYEIGCDGPSDLHFTWPDAPDHVLDRKRGESRPVLADVEKYLRSDDWRALAGETGAEPIPATLATWGGWRFGREGMGRVLALAAERAAEARARGERRRADRDAAVDAARAAARAAGKPVLLDRWTEECDGSVDECSTDVCYRHAHPDGSLRVSRQHTF